ncbi:MAG: hypothetical protein M3230_04980, partial [Thermoproteota archaeon]|nr:hypothetical protein [Thermoproteota archaeon]
LTLASASEDVPIWCLPYILHFIIRDSWASRFNDIGSDNNFVEVKLGCCCYVSNRDVNLPQVYISNI